MRKNRNVFALLLAAVLAFSMVPASALAITGDPVGQVYVTIDSSLSTSSQFTNEGWVDIYSDDSAITIIQRFAESQYADATVDIAIGDTGYSFYVSEINDLAEFENGAESGWMGLINDWFTADAFAFYTVANGDIEDGDTLSIQYTVSGYGADLGGSWADNDKTLKSLEVASPDIEPASTILSLSPAFTSGNNEYSLSLPLGTDSVNIIPTATNKNFQVRIFVGGTEYKRTDSIPVSNGTVITVVCGEVGWPTMNNWSGSDAVAAETYSITVGWKQLAGDSRYETMEAISQEGFDNADTVIVATGENYPDALAAAGLAGINDAPILLTAQGWLSPEVATEIVRLGAKNVIIVGGTGVVSSTIEAQLDAVEGVTSVTRASGNDRVTTALDIYAKGGTDWSRTAIIATGFDFADALSIAPYAYATDSPIFLTGGAATNADISDVTKAVLKTEDFDKIIIVGDIDVVSQGVEDELAAIFGAEDVTRLSGEDRYQTSADIADFATSNGLTYQNVAVSTGMNFPDALAGSALCGKNSSVLLLVDDSAAGLFCVDNSITGKKSSIELGYFLGGDGVISPGLQEKILNAELI